MQYRESFEIKRRYKKCSVLATQSIFVFTRAEICRRKDGLDMIMILVIFPPVKSQPQKKEVMAESLWGVLDSLKMFNFTGGNRMTTATGTTNQIIREIDDHIRKCGGGYSLWYVGIASDPKDRLFNDHNVDEKNDAWIHRDCGSESAARRVEKHFLTKGCDGGAGGGDYSTKYAYAYKKKSHTRP